MLLKEEKLPEAAAMFEKAGDVRRAALLQGEIAFHKGDTRLRRREVSRGRRQPARGGALRDGGKSRGGGALLRAERRRHPGGERLPPRARQDQSRGALSSAGTISSRQPCSTRSRETRRRPRRCTNSRIASTRREESRTPSATPTGPSSCSSRWTEATSTTTRRLSSSRSSSSRRTCPRSPSTSSSGSSANSRSLPRTSITSTASGSPTRSSGTSPKRSPPSARS